MAKRAKKKTAKQTRDSLGRRRHPNQNSGSRSLAQAGQADGGKGIRIPAHLGKLGKESFRKLRDLLADRDFLDTADASLIELWAAAYEDWRDARKEVRDNGVTMEVEGSTGGWVTKKNPAVDVMSDAWKRMKSLVPEFGLSPSARAKLAGSSDEKDEDPLEAFLKRKN